MAVWYGNGAWSRTSSRAQGFFFGLQALARSGHLEKKEKQSQLRVEKNARRAQRMPPQVQGHESQSQKDSEMAGAAALLGWSLRVSATRRGCGLGRARKEGLKIGFIPLTDCASVSSPRNEVRREACIKITPSKEASWAAVRTSSSTASSMPRTCSMD